VQFLVDINNIIIPHFNKYPLLTQKRTDFEFFKLIIDLMNKKEHLNLKGISRIINYRASMNKGLSDKLKNSFPNITLIKRPINMAQKILNLW